MTTADPHTDTSGSSPEPSAPPFRYTADLANTIETRWQAHWDDAHTHKVPNPGEKGFDASKPKFYCLDMFPYPSGAGLHVGHPEGYTASDIISRFMRMNGHNVLHPMGWDAFGLPAEQYAIQTGVHPAETTRKAINNFRRQLKRFGFCYDWSREFATIDPLYYKWTQWIFLQAYGSWFDTTQNKARPIKELIMELESGDLHVSAQGDPVHVGTDNAHLAPLGTEPAGDRRWHELSKHEQREFLDNQRLAYLDEVTVNWCPRLGTVLANEEVIDGKSERGGYPVYRRPLRQWMFRITAYAQRLLDGLSEVDWPESTRAQQTEWIGRSVGCELDFPLLKMPPTTLPDPASAAPYLRVYTTRPDTVCGATYMVVAPEHPLVDAALASKNADTEAPGLREYVESARNKSDIERTADTKEKTGVFTGLYAVNPATGEDITVWCADYVLMGYGHGAIMAVPAHDQRDYEFAEKFGLPIHDVVYPRAVMVMRHFATHATDIEKIADNWKNVLADMLGLVITSGLEPEHYDDVLEAVRGRRSEPPPIEDLTPEQRAAMQLLTPRGAIAGGYLEAIEDMGFETFHDFAECFARGEYYKSRGSAYTGTGYAVNSTTDPHASRTHRPMTLDGLQTADAKARVTKWAEKSGIGRRKINFKLRDWLFSRQRYWGEPFPIVFTEDGNHYPVDPSALPVKLPQLQDYKPPITDDPAPLLAKAQDWAETTAGKAGVNPDVLPPETPVRRETNTMPGWAGSCWYYLRYADPHNAYQPIGEQADRYWMAGPTTHEHAAVHHDGKKHATNGGGSEGDGGVDLYIGGAEHAVLHLLYARFWHMLLHDLGHVKTREPFKKLFHQGLILSHAFQRPDKSLVPVDEVEFEKDTGERIPPVQVDENDQGRYVETATGQRVTRVIAKMSKSLKNVVNPDDIIEGFGADTFRLYEMYLGPLEASKPWNTRDIVGLSRFLQRAWRLCINEDTGEIRASDTESADLERALHKAIDKVRTDIPNLAFNTAIASLIEFVNTCTSADRVGPPAHGVLTKDQIGRFALVLGPFVPHIAEELWHKLGKGVHSGGGDVIDQPFPAADPAKLVEDQVEIPVQIMGKLRHKIVVAPSATKEQIEEAALADAKVQELLAGKTVRKTIVVPGKMINFVAN